MSARRSLPLGLLVALAAAVSLALAAPAAAQVPIPCIQFTRDGEDIPGEEHCEPLARDVHIAFAGSAFFRYTLDGMPIGDVQEAPENARDVSCDFHRSGSKAGTIKRCHWTDADGKKIPPGRDGDLPIPKGQDANDFVLLATLTRVEWTGRGVDGFPKNVEVPEGANDIRFFFRSQT